jgi:hypothetical protein
LCEKENSLFICSNVSDGYKRKVARFKRECINPNFAAEAEVNKNDDEISITNS